MSTEPSEGETTTAPAVTANSQADITQQATALTPKTQRVKDPKRVAAGKMVAERTKKCGLSINQWIGVGGLAVSLAGIYYKREELKAAFSK